MKILEIFCVVLLLACTVVLVYSLIDPRFGL